MEEYLNFAKSIAYEAGNIIKEYFDKNLDYENKSDDSPVTIIDKKINKLVIEKIKSKYPTHSVFGEEEDNIIENSEYIWLCDPLDGTKPFILNVPCSVFMLALLKNGEVQMSVVYEPHFDKLYYAIRGQGAYCNNKKIHVNQNILEGNYVLMGGTTYYFADGLKSAGAKLEPVSGGGYKEMMIARGDGVATIRDKADFHDVGPAALIVEEAGGLVTDFDGNSLRLDRPIKNVVVSNKIVHQEILAIIKKGIKY